MLGEFLGLAFAAGRAAALTAEAPLVVRMAWFDSFAPLSFKDAQGVMKGILVESLNAVGALCNIAFEHHGFPWLRAQENVRSGQMDAVCTLPTRERLEYLTFTRLPVAEQRIGIYHRSNDPRIKGIQSVQDMRAFKQGSYRGNGFAKEFLEENLISFQNDLESVFRLIALGSIDIFVDGELAAKDTFVRYGLADKIEFTPASFLHPVDYHLGLRSNFEHAAAVLARLDGAIGAARRSGVLAAIYRKYV